MSDSDKFHYVVRGTFICIAVVVITLWFARPTIAPEIARYWEPKVDRSADTPIPFELNCAYPLSREDADLCQQARMAKSVNEAASDAGFQFLLSFLGFVALIATVFYAAKSSHATEEAARAARDALEFNKNAEQPRLHRIDVEPHWDNETLLAVSITLENIGRLPAVVRSSICFFGQDKEAIISSDIFLDYLSIGAGRVVRSGEKHRIVGMPWPLAELGMTTDVPIYLSYRYLYESPAGGPTEAQFCLQGARSPLEVYLDRGPIIDWTEVGGSQLNFEREISKKPLRTATNLCGKSSCK